MSKELLDDVHAFLGRFVVYPSEHARVAHTLWIAHAHMMEEWYITPRLLFLSPTRGTGKTRAMQITSLLVPSSIFTVNATAPYIYRRLGDPNKPLPTLLYDEIDTVFGIRSKKDTEDLRAILNSGYKRGATVGRCVGDKYDTQEFPVFCAVALAGIDRLTGFDTVLSRSIVIEMQRRKQGEDVEDYRSRDVDPEGDKLRERLAESSVAQKGIGDDRPKMPKGLIDRDAELWEPLLAIADRAGGDWPERARVAAVALVALTGKDTREDLGDRLLSDLRIVFKDEEKKSTNGLINNIINIEESPWSTIDNGRPINDRLLAEMLNPYGIKSENIRIGDKVMKGYYRKSFTDAWERYVPLPQEALQELQELEADQPLETPGASVTSATSATGATKDVAFDEWFETMQQHGHHGLKIRF